MIIRIKLQIGIKAMTKYIEFYINWELMASLQSFQINANQYSNYNLHDTKWISNKLPKSA